MTLLELIDATTIRIMHCNDARGHNDSLHRFPSFCREGLIASVAMVALSNCCTLPKAAHPVYDRSVVSTQRLAGSDECFPN